MNESANKQEMVAIKSSMPWFLASGWRLFGTLFLTLALPMAMLALTVATQVRHALREQAVHQNTVAAHLVSQSVREHFEGLVRYVESFARRPNLVSLIEKKDTEGIRAHLKDLVTQHTKFDRTFITDTHGILWYDYPHAPEVIGKDFSFRDWYKGVSEAQKTYVSEVYRRAAPPRPFLVAIATPIRNARQATIGYLVGQHTLDALTTWLTQVKPSATGSVALVDHHGVLAMKHDSGNESPLYLGRDPMAQEALGGQEGSVETADPVTGEESLISYTSVGGIGWAVLSRQPIAAVFAPVTALQRTIFGLALVSFLAMLGMGYLWLHTIRRYHQALLESDKAKDRYLTELTAVNRELEAFSYSVSHDLRAPLRGIDGFSQALLEDHAEKLDAQGKDYLQRVRAASQRMAQLIDDLLQLSRLARGEIHREEVDLSGMARAIAAELQKTQPDRQVEVRIAQGVVVEGDPRLLRVVLDNLLSNAWKFTSKNPRATIEFGVIENDGRPVYFVQDDGAGFDMAYGDKLFGPFQRLHAPTEFSGTGIGLATVQRIVHRHGGRVWAAGAVGQGATFSFTL